MPYDFYVWGRKPDAADVRVAVAELAALGIWMIVQGSPGEGYLPVELRVRDPRAFAHAESFVAAGTLYTGCECLSRTAASTSELDLTVFGASTWAISPTAEVVCAAFLAAAVAKATGGVLEDPQTGQRLSGADALDAARGLAEEAADLACLREGELLRLAEPESA